MQFLAFGREIPCETTTNRKVTGKLEFVSKMWVEGSSVFSGNNTSSTNGNHTFLFYAIPF